MLKTQRDCVKVIILAACVLAGPSATAVQAMTQDEARAQFEQLKQAAEAGDEKSQCDVADWYRAGNPYIGLKMDIDAAREWYEKCAQHGNVATEEKIAGLYAAGLLGDNQTYYVDGIFHTKSGDEAVVWYRRAIASGSISAAWELGAREYYGNGVPQDKADAEKLLRELAAQPGSDQAKAKTLLAQIDAANGDTASASAGAKVVQTSGQSTPALTAAAVAAKGAQYYWRLRTVKCGDDYYDADFGDDGLPTTITEYKGVVFHPFVWEAIPQVDRLNGYQWVADSEMNYTFSRSGVRNGSEYEWGDWVENTSGQSNMITIKKRFDTVSGTDESSRPLTCTDLLLAPRAPLAIGPARTVDQAPIVKYADHSQGSDSIKPGTHVCIVALLNDPALGNLAVINPPPGYIGSWLVSTKLLVTDPSGHGCNWPAGVPTPYQQGY